MRRRIRCRRKALEGKKADERKAKEDQENNFAEGTTEGLSRQGAISRRKERGER